MPGPNWIGKCSEASFCKVRWLCRKARSEDVCSVSELTIQAGKRVLIVNDYDTSNDENPPSLNNASSVTISGRGKLFFLKSGCCITGSEMRESNMISINTLPEHTLLNIGPSFSSMTSYYFVHALTDLQLCVFDSVVLMSDMIEDPDGVYVLLDAQADAIKAGLTHSCMLSGKGVRTRVILFFKTIIDGSASAKQVGLLPISISHMLLSHIVNARRSSIDATLKQLSDEGLIDIGYRNIQLNVERILDEAHALALGRDAFELSLFGK